MRSNPRQIPGCYVERNLIFFCLSIGNILKCFKRSMKLFGVFTSHPSIVCFTQEKYPKGELSIEMNRLSFESLGNIRHTVGFHSRYISWLNLVPCKDLTGGAFVCSLLFINGILSINFAIKKNLHFDRFIIKLLPIQYIFRDKIYSINA